MKTHAILQPLFDIVNKIHCDTFLPLEFSACTYHIQEPSSGNMDFKALHWYIGIAGHELYGKFTDKLDIENLDEDKLNRWVEELTAIYDEEMGLVEEPDPDEESREDIARHENHVINSQEDSQI